MSTGILSLPDEMLLKILRYVMQSNTPIHTPNIAHLPRINLLKQHLIAIAIASLKQFEAKTCTQPLCKWFTLVHEKSRCLCFLGAMTEHQVSHLKDWVLANGISQRFQGLAKEAFFEANKQVFIITPKDLEQLQYPITTASTLHVIQRIVVPLPARGAASAWLRLPRYLQFNNLRVLAVWPDRMDPEDYCFDFEARKLSQDPMPEAVRTLLKDIGLERADLRLDMIRSTDEEERIGQIHQLEARVFPALRWVGAQKKKRQQQNEKDINVRQPEEEAKHAEEKAGKEFDTNC
ncbi:MAG: hypothetical protein Q9221_000773 [Calogaya cf. arnoldii]